MPATAIGFQNSKATPGFGNVKKYVFSLPDGDNAYKDDMTITDYTNAVTESTFCDSGCIYNNCAALPTGVCGTATGQVDLYNGATPGSGVYVDTCVYAGNSCGKYDGNEVIRAVASGSQKTGSLAWYSGSDSYDGSYKFTCTDAKDNETPGYPNVMCLRDPSDENTFSSTIEVKCTQSSVSRSAAEISGTFYDCSAQQCSDVPTELCKVQIDLYKVDPENADGNVFVETCVQAEGEDACIKKPEPGSTTVAPTGTTSNSSNASKSSNSDTGDASGVVSVLSMALMAFF